MKPQSRPRCPTCYGAGTILEPFSDCEVACPQCFGPGFDPYWLGPTAPAPEPEGDA